MNASEILAKRPVTMRRESPLREGCEIGSGAKTPIRESSAELQGGMLGSSVEGADKTRG